MSGTALDLVLVERGKDAPNSISSPASSYGSSSVTSSVAARVAAGVATPLHELVIDVLERHTTCPALIQILIHLLTFERREVKCCDVIPFAHATPRTFPFLPLVPTSSLLGIPHLKPTTSLSPFSDSQQQNSPNEKTSIMGRHRTSYSSSTIPLDPTISIASVEHLLVDVDFFKRAKKPGGVTKPQLFKKHRKSRQLSLLQSSHVWKNGKRDEQVLQMEEWFPSVAQPLSAPASNPKAHSNTKSPSNISMQSLSLGQLPPVSFKNDCPESDIGKYFYKLPGELRNRIYRLAVLQETNTVEVSTKPETCSQGACTHTKTSFNVPGIANTCRQMRWEVMPIFVAENRTWAFDAGVVHNCCVGNTLRSLGDYADLIPQFELAINRPLWNRDSFTEYATYRFTLFPPKNHIANSQWDLVQVEKEGRVICDCAPRKLLTAMNANRESAGKAVVDFVESEEWADFVWRVRKTKQQHAHLSRCKKCGESCCLGAATAGSLQRALLFPFADFETAWHRTRRAKASGREILGRVWRFGIVARTAHRASLVDLAASCKADGILEMKSNWSYIIVHSSFILPLLHPTSSAYCGPILCLGLYRIVLLSSANDHGPKATDSSRAGHISSSLRSAVQIRRLNVEVSLSSIGASLDRCATRSTRHWIQFMVLQGLDARYEEVSFNKIIISYAQVPMLHECHEPQSLEPNLKGEEERDVIKL
ncbi:uncharacterized protein MYCFIDRAFT_178128 [Pseudocercospora fijiensis CIRAD86]|uniref:2EXR domain-containing protein n=1 Tax=Pseudocercospora fijiensis (strain CIRAD86) TaxID=383855 RepID=M2YP51_PSEFD|nr:uncharacterized protein MYCFIDRAFT_178128 [Pseudocercospora fijiensis CIRAD86]EME79540.1 hypothetical protein MYCFIDRAFT_178128 [Pseudocercospora fijiensis CIRAD86]